MDTLQQHCVCVQLSQIARRHYLLIELYLVFLAVEQLERHVEHLVVVDQLGFVHMGEATNSQLLLDGDLVVGVAGAEFEHITHADLRRNRVDELQIGNHHLAHVWHVLWYHPRNVIVLVFVVDVKLLLSQKGNHLGHDQFVLHHLCERVYLL